MRAHPQRSLRELIAAPKPAFSAEGFVRDEAHEADRPFTAVFDGRESWVIDRPERAEVTLPGRTIIAHADGEEVIEGTVSVNGDVKVHLDGRRIANLADATFEEGAATVVAGRRCRHAVVHGLRRDGEPFEIDVDEETGAILRLTRPQTGAEFQITRYLVGDAALAALRDAAPRVRYFPP